MDISPLWDVGLVMIFSQFVGCYFVLLTMSFPFRSFAVLCGSTCWVLFLEHKPLVFYSGTLPLCPCIQDSFPTFSSQVSLCLVLCVGPWSNWTWALFKELECFPNYVLILYEFHIMYTIQSYLIPFNLYFAFGTSSPETNQSINQSINQSKNQSINQTTKKE